MLAVSGIDPRESCGLCLLVRRPPHAHGAARNKTGVERFEH